MALRAVVADDNYLVREGLSALLTEADDVEVVEAVADPQALLAAVAAHEPDAVLTDIRMPPTFTDEGITAARRIRAEHPAIGVVVLSQYVEGDDPYELLKDGVAGVGDLLLAAVVGLLYVLPVVAILLPDGVARVVVPLLPGNAGGAVMQLESAGMLPPWVGIALFAGYAALLLVAAALVLPRRDA